MSTNQPKEVEMTLIEKTQLQMKGLKIATINRIISNGWANFKETMWLIEAGLRDDIINDYMDNDYTYATIKVEINAYLKSVKKVQDKQKMNEYLKNNKLNLFKGTSIKQDPVLNTCIAKPIDFALNTATNLVIRGITALKK